MRQAIRDRAAAHHAAEFPLLCLHTMTFRRAALKTPCFTKAVSPRSRNDPYT
jgi:hypothetical protein